MSDQRNGASRGYSMRLATALRCLRQRPLGLVDQLKQRLVFAFEVRLAVKDITNPYEIYIDSLFWIGFVILAVKLYDH